MAPTIYAWVDWKGVNSRKVTASALMSSKTLPQTILRDVLFFDESIDSKHLRSTITNFKFHLSAKFMGNFVVWYRNVVPSNRFSPRNGLGNLDS